MKEILYLLYILSIMVICNLIGGIYVNLEINKINFDIRKFIVGIVKAICVATMFVGLAYVIEKVPEISNTLGVQPKALILYAIGIYAAKVLNHLMSIFGYKKDNKIEDKDDEEYMGM